MRNQTFSGLFYSENFPKIDIDTPMNLCYIGNKSLHGLFCKNVHVFVKAVSYNNVDYLFKFFSDYEGLHILDGRTGVQGFGRDALPVK